MIQDLIETNTLNSNLINNYFINGNLNSKCNMHGSEQKTSLFNISEDRLHYNRILLQ